MKNTTLKQQAYCIIKEKIINCEYAPNTILNEEKLKEEIGASRTPIRDAISRLEQERLVTILPKQGIMVAPLSLREINALHEVRVLIEPYTIEHYGQKIPKEKFLDYKETFLRIKNALENDEIVAGDMYELDDQFHLEFINVMENEYFTSIHEQVYNQNHRLRILSGTRGKNRMLETQDEHLKIVEYCIEEDWNSAAEAMKEHLLYAKKSWFNAILHNDDMII